MLTFSINKTEEQIFNEHIFKALKDRDLNTLSSEELDLITGEALEKTKSNKSAGSDAIEKDSLLSRATKDISTYKYRNYIKARIKEEQKNFINLPPETKVEDLIDTFLKVSEDFTEIIQSKDYHYIYRVFYQFQLECYFRHNVDIEILIERIIVDKSKKALEKFKVVIPDMTDDVKDVLFYMMSDYNLLLGFKYDDYMEDYKKKAREYVYKTYNETAETIREELVQSLKLRAEQQEKEFNEIQELNELIKTF